LQAQALVRAKEIMVHKLTTKMEVYFPRLLEFQTSPEAVVKQQVVESVMECMEAVPRLDFLIAATGCVRHLLNDAFPSVLKAALAGARTLVLVSLHALCYASPAERQQAESQWTALKGVLETVTGTLVSHKNAGVRMLTFKLLEHVALMTSASHCPGIKGEPCMTSWTWARGRLGLVRNWQVHIHAHLPTCMHRYACGNDVHLFSQFAPAGHDLARVCCANAAFMRCPI
jgi:hypothetical protein